MQHCDLKEWDPDWSFALIMKIFDLYRRVHWTVGFLYRSPVSTGFLSHLNIQTSHVLVLITPLVCALIEANIDYVINHLSTPQHFLSSISSICHRTLLRKWCASVLNWRNWDFPPYLYLLIPLRVILRPAHTNTHTHPHTKAREIISEETICLDLLQFKGN